MSKCVPYLALLITLLVAACSESRFGSGQTLSPSERPPEQRGLVLVSHFNETLPKALKFVDQDGKKRTLGDYFDGRRPVLISFNYESCPMLCGQQLNGLTDTLGKMELAPGRDFQILTVSLDPAQVNMKGKTQQKTYWERILRPDVPLDGWQFLQGTQQAIKALTEAVGYPYRYLPEQKQFIHAPIYAVCTPDGRISSYFESVAPDPQDLRLFLVDASDGKIGSAIDQVLMWCFHYDPEAGTYSADAVKLMSVGGAVILVVLGVLLWRLWRFDLRRQRTAVESQA